MISLEGYRSVLLVAALGFSIVLTGSAQPQKPLSPGASLPSIDAPLQRVDNGETVRLKQLTGSTGTVVLFWSNRCPWVDRYDGRVQRLVSTFQERGIQFVRVNANDAAEWPEASLEASRTRAEKRGYSTPYVRDPTAALARALGATRTPHAFVFDGTGTLVYVGAIDDSPGDPERVQAPYLRKALEALEAGKAPSVERTKAFGCTLKYPE